jgi:glutamate--cysteine ligase
MSKNSSVIPILKSLVEQKSSEIEAWFKDAFSKTPPFFYNSVDLRHSGFKLAPVDTNLFPGGFNNLNTAEQQHASETAKNYLSQHHNNAKNILIIAEDHTRNSYYLENVWVLKTLLENAGANVCVSSFQCSIDGEELELTTQSGKALTFKPLVKKGTSLQTVDDFTPDLVVVNNDLTEGAPDIIQDITQTVIPPVGFGWYQRRKTSHFESYNQITRRFCEHFDFDPWLISTDFHRCGIVNFKEKKGIECVAIGIEKVLHKIRKKYEEYGINEKPYVFIKSDRGTYGMGIMTAYSGEDVFSMSKNIRKKMNTIKGGTTNTEVIIQEGVPTIDTVNDSPAEPMIYMIGAEPVGCIYRINEKRDSYGNLNASGMHFASMSQHHEENNLCRSLGLVSKLASYAAAWECYTDSYQI